MAEILEPNNAELILDEGESTGNIEEDNHAMALDDEAAEAEVAPEASNLSVDPEPARGVAREVPGQESC